MGWVGIVYYLREIAKDQELREIYWKIPGWNISCAIVWKPADLRLFSMPAIKAILLLCTLKSGGELLYLTKQLLSRVIPIDWLLFPLNRHLWQHLLQNLNMISRNSLVVRILIFLSSRAHWCSFAIIHIALSCSNLVIYVFLIKKNNRSIICRI